MTSNAQAKLEYIAETKAAIKAAIEGKGVMVDPAVTFRQYATKIGDIQTSVPEAVDFLVRFIDYDGTILKEQRVNSGQDATAPTLPTHSLLTFNSWNGDFSMVTADIDIGAIYDTTDGKSHLFITLTVPTGLAPILHLTKFTADVMTINWGDGISETDSTNDNFFKTHTYAAAGDYIITIECAGSYTFGEDYNYPAIFEEYPYILTKILIGHNVTSIIRDAFAPCNSLQSIVIPVGVTSIGDNAFYNCNSLQSIVIPFGVTSIGSSAFNGCNSLQSIVIPVGVTSIGSYTFNGCNSLQSIVIPVGVININYSAFANCISLQSIVIPVGITSIENNVFNGCSSLQSIVIPDSVISIGNYAFNYCFSLQSITIPDSVTSIGYNVFADCNSLQSIVIPFGVTSIGDNSFYDCYSLQSIVIPDSVTSIGYNVFNYCTSLQNITIPAGCIVGSDLFEKCYALTTITIPEGQTIIGNDFAYENKSLKSIYLPSTISSIADDAFSLCQQLNTLEILATTPPTLVAGAFDTYSKILKIYVPAASVDAYKIATNWSALADYIYPII